MSKRFNTMENIGHARYVVNYHDGVSTHPDGSPFYGAAIFTNRRKRDAFIRSLVQDGYEAE